MNEETGEVITENYRFKNRSEYIRALDMVLPTSFEKERDIPTGKHHYYPIDVQEGLADDLFHEWNVTDENYSLFANELLCTVRITFTPSYPGAQERFCTGSAAIAVQMDSGAKITDFPAKKKTNALQYNAPAVREMAIGNALQSLGNIFGRNLARKTSSNFTIRKHEPAPDSKSKNVPVQPSNPVF